MIIIVALLVTGFFYFHHQSRPQSVRHPVKREVFYNYRIVALGDSLTQGVGDQKNGGYVGLTAAALKKQRQVKQVQLTNYGHMGDTTSDLLKVLQREKVRKSLKQANTIFLTIGGNDLASVLTQHFMNLQKSDFTGRQKNYSANLNKIFADIRTLNPRAPVYFFGLYNPFQDYFGKANKDFEPILNGWNRQSKNISSKYSDIYFLPTEAIFKGKYQSLLYEDHFHPNKKGYEDMTALLVRAINKKR